MFAVFSFVLLVCFLRIPCNGLKHVFTRRQGAKHKTGLEKFLNQGTDLSLYSTVLAFVALMNNIFFLFLFFLFCFVFVLYSFFYLSFCSRFFVCLFLDKTAAALNKHHEDNLIESATLQNKEAIFKNKPRFTVRHLGFVSSW